MVEAVAEPAVAVLDIGVVPGIEVVAGIGERYRNHLLPWHVNRLSARSVPAFSPVYTLRKLP